MESVQNTSVQTSIYRDLPLSQLQESPFNPRKRFYQTSLEELAQSIRSQGVLAPLLVRELEVERFEIVAGSRRYRAAQIAELPAVPVRIVELSDAEAQLAMAIENLQREDVHPLEEARAFANLSAQHYDVATIAAKVGRSDRFVAERIRLNELIQPIAEAFLEDKLTTGHALLIAKLPVSQQLEAFGAAYRKVWTGGSDSQVLLPVKELAVWIEGNLLLDLSSAPFDRADAGLVPEAGSCDDCPKRTGANALLFSGNGPDACLDRACFTLKVDRHIVVSVERKPDLVQISSSWGNRTNGALSRGEYIEITPAKKSKGPLTAAQKRCPSLSKGIVTEGGSRGQVLTICADPKCEVHFADAQRSKVAEAKAREQRREEDTQRKIELTTRQRVVAAIIPKITSPLQKGDLALIAKSLLGRVPFEQTRHIALRHKLLPDTKAWDSTNFSRILDAHIKTLDEIGLCRMLVELALQDHATNFYSKDAPVILDATAKRHRISVEKIAQAVTAEFETKQKKLNQRRKSGKAQTPASKSKAASKRKPR